MSCSQFGTCTHRCGNPGSAYPAHQPGRHPQRKQCLPSTNTATGSNIACYAGKCVRARCNKTKDAIGRSFRTLWNRWPVDQAFTAGCGGQCPGVECVQGLRNPGELLVSRRFPKRFVTASSGQGVIFTSEGEKLQNGSYATNRVHNLHRVCRPRDDQSREHG